MIETQQNVHTRISIIRMCTAVLGGPKTAFGAIISMCTQDPVVCKHVWVAPTLVFQSLTLPTHTFGRLTICFSIVETQKQEEHTTAFFVIHL